MKTINKKNLLKLAMMSVAMFMFTAAMGQGGDITEYGLVGDNGDSYVTHEATISLYALPDPVYNPNWSNFGDALDANSQWTWSSAVGWAWNTELTLSQTDNYVEITGNEIGGPYQVSVVEGFNGAGGLCEGATPRLFNVHVLGKPTAEIAGGNANSWDVASAGLSFFTCTDGLAEELTITIAEVGVPAALASYAYAIERVVEEIDVNGALVANGNNSTGTLVDNTIDGKLLSGNEIGGATHTVNTGEMSPIYDETNTNRVRTRYTFTLKKPSDALGADGIVSAISHKSDYLSIASGGNVNTYPFGTDVQVVYIVNLPPVTGPIYHIPNNFNAL